MATVNAEIEFQDNNDAFFTTNAAVIYDAGIQIFHVDGRYKFGDGVTALSALPFRGASSGGSWGSITGTLSAQTDLQNALNAKQNSGSYATGTGTANGTNTGDETAARIGAITNGATDYPTPLDADKIGIWDVVNGLFKALTWANLKATLKTYFDTKYTHFFQGTSFSPLDSNAYYIDASGRAPSTTENLRTFKFAKGGTVQSVVFNLFHNIPGSSQDVTLYLRNSDTATDYLVGTYSYTGFINTSFVFSGLNIPINTTNLWTLKYLAPVFNPFNPTGVVVNGHILID